MKKVVLLLTLLISCLPLFSQNAEQADNVEQVSKKIETKFDKYTSSYGVFSQFAEYEMPNFKLDGGYINEVKIRVYTDLQTNKKTCFLRLRSGYAYRVESIEYSDLIKIIEAIPKLKDLASNTQQQGEYMQTLFISDDGFQIGWYMEKGKISWVMTVDSQWRTFKSNYDFESAFVEIKNRMTSLMK